MYKCDALKEQLNYSIFNLINFLFSIFVSVLVILTTNFQNWIYSLVGKLWAELIILFFSIISTFILFTIIKFLYNLWVFRWKFRGLFKNITLYAQSYYFKYEEVEDMKDDDNKSAKLLKANFLMNVKFKVDYLQGRLIINCENWTIKDGKEIKTSVSENYVNYLLYNAKNVCLEYKYNNQPDKKAFKKEKLNLTNDFVGCSQFLYNRKTKKFIGGDYHSDFLKRYSFGFYVLKKEDKEQKNVN